MGKSAIRVEKYNFGGIQIMGPHISILTWFSAFAEFEETEASGKNEQGDDHEHSWGGILDFSMDKQVDIVSNYTYLLLKN